MSFFEDENGAWLTTAHYTNQPDTKQLSSLIQDSLSLNTSDFTLSISNVEDIDWVSHVQKNLSPVTAGRFFIHGTHDRHQAINKSNTIEIDAAQAFGTAHHGTTRGCLETISALADTLNPAAILDLGTGTGILAIAAKMCWPEAKIIASDIDPIAVEIAAANISHNIPDAGVETCHADGLGDNNIAAHAPFALIIANILAKPLISLAPSIAIALNEGGLLILSGLLSEQHPKIEAAYQEASLISTNQTEIDNWLTCSFIKP